MDPKNSKNKRPPPASSASSQQNAPNAKRRKLFADRNLSTQTASSAFKGEIDLSSFVKAREYEIRALEEGIQKSKKALSSRAFQEVPRELRRRQASHNAKRVPARLRSRASREMVEDNTPTVSSKTRGKSGRMRLRLDTARKLKGLGKSKKKEPRKKDDAEASDTTIEVKITPAEVQLQAKSSDVPLCVRKPRVKKAALSKPPTPPAKFRKRQMHKTWLPTHMYHTKRAKMTPPKEPLWRYAIPLSPSMKSYRPTHRASTLRGAVAWDTSYMTTIGLEGAEKSVENLLRALGVGVGEALWSKSGKKWKAGLRAWHGWLYEREAYPKDSIAPTTIIWCPKQSDQSTIPQPPSTSPDQAQTSPKRKVLVRVHPAGSLRAWEQIVRLSKVQKPSVVVEDLRFEIGSIEITGPASAEALTSVLWPSKSSPESLAETTWPKLSQLNNCASLPGDAIISFAISDPRLHHPPRRIPPPNVNEAELLEILTDWPLDRSSITSVTSGLFDRAARTAASRSLPSQKAINRRKSDLNKRGAYPKSLASDPDIPVLLFTKRNPIHNGQGAWTLLLPWKCVLPVWYSLMYYPVSTGGNPRFGGLEEIRQLAFESGTPWFPGDFPGTTAGDLWQKQENETRQKDWERMPKGKRVEWSTLDLGLDRKGELGLGWACDWDYLSQLQADSGPEDTVDVPRLRRVPSHIAQQVFQTTSLSASIDASASLCTVNLSLLSRGTATTCARIYRLPTTNNALRESWLKLIPGYPSKVNNTSLACSCATTNHLQQVSPHVRSRFHKLPNDAPAHERRARLASILLRETNVRPSEQDHPAVPDAVDLIGFVTTGNYNLCEGKVSAIGSLLMSKILPAAEAPLSTSHGRLCIVRNSGQKNGRLARWTVV